MTQFRGAICCEQEQGHAGHVGLDDSGVEFQGCGAGGADEGDWAAGGLGQPERKEAGAAFVEMEEGLDFGVGVEGKGQWCRARAGRDADSLQAGTGQGGDQCFGKE